MRRVLVVLGVLGLLSWPNSAGAQVIGGRSEITPLVGGISFDADIPSLGSFQFRGRSFGPLAGGNFMENDFIYGARATYFFTSRIGIEATVAISQAQSDIFPQQPSGDVNPNLFNPIVAPTRCSTLPPPPDAPPCVDQINRDFDLFVYHGNLVFNLLTGPFKPYVTAGIGGITINPEIRVLDGTLITEFLYNFGGGLKWFFTDHVALTADVRDAVFTLNRDDDVFNFGEYFWQDIQKVLENAGEFSDPGRAGKVLKARQEFFGEFGKQFNEAFEGSRHNILYTFGFSFRFGQ